MEWITNLVNNFTTFMKTDPGLGLIVLAVVALAGRKGARHFSKKTAYTVKQFWRYPGEVVEMAVIILLVLFGLLKFTGVI